MPPFPAPHNLMPDLFAALPAAGTLVTEEQALRLVLRLVRTSTALLGTFHEQLQEAAEAEIYLTVTDLILQIQALALALLKAWYASQHPEEDDDDEEDDDEAEPTPPNRRPRRRDTDA